MRIALLYETKPEVLPEGAPSDLYMELENIEDIERVCGALERLGHTVSRVHALNDPLPRLLELRGRVDLVFNYSVGFGTRSREVVPAALCEVLKIPFTGSDAMALALASNKHATKLLVRQDGMATPEWLQVGKVEELEEGVWPEHPVVVKPTYEGSSIGVRGPFAPDDAPALRRAVREALETYAQPVLVERFIAGYEVTMPVVGSEPRPVHPIGLRIDGRLELDTVFDAANKADTDAHVWTADLLIDGETRARIESWACRVHRLLGCRDFSRSDFRITPSGEVYFLEINPTSQLTDSFRAAARAAGGDLETVLDSIVESARVRWGL